MFHTRIISESIARYEASTGHRLTEHSVADATRVYDHFATITRTDGKHSWYARRQADGTDEPQADFRFQPWELEWIRNELAMCACSFPYWFFRYFFIRTLSGAIVRPETLVAQQIYLDILADIESRGLPMMLLVLKARQLGLSTITEAIILWLALFRRGMHNVIASAEEDKSEQMSNMVWTGLENLPAWMMPRLTGQDRKRGPEFGDNATDILIQHGSMSKGIARGDTPQACHLSEVAYFPNPIETIESSLIRAMHENPRTFLVLETTARRKGDWFHNTWVANREGEATGYNRFTCIFLPWYVGHDKYPTRDWVRNHPIPAVWEPRRETRKQVHDAELYVATTPLLKRYLPAQDGVAWRMPREQQWFWEFNYVEAARDDETLKSFMAEMASDERSCFQSKRWSVYTQETLDRIELHISKVHYTDYAVVGDGVNKKFWLQDWWSGRRRIPIEYASIRGMALSWQLIPLRATPTSDADDSYLRIWEHPKPGYKYTCAWDVSDGIGQNATCGEVLRIGREIDEPDIQVAEIRTTWMSAAEAPPIAHALGAYYGQYMSPTPEALVAPETQIAVGDLISHQLAEDGYSNFHYMERYDLKKTPGHKSRRRGWVTNAWSRPLMEQTLKAAIDNGWLVVNSEFSLEDMKNQEAEETDSGKTKFDHAKGATDDTQVGLGIAYFVSHDQQTLSERKSGKRKPRPHTTEDEQPKPPPLPGDSLRAMLQREEQRLHDPQAEERGWHVY